MRQAIRDIVSQITPFDKLERTHKQSVLDWIDSGAPLFRIEKPDKPPKHLVSYFALFDEKTGQFMLIDHVKAQAWVPPGGHVDVDEDPRYTVIREAKEELGINASFDTKYGDSPLLVTETITKGYGNHTDVSLWYVIRGDSGTKLTYDQREMSEYKWLSPTEILAMDITLLDPQMHRFIRKTQQWDR